MLKGVQLQHAEQTYVLILSKNNQAEHQSNQQGFEAYQLLVCLRLVSNRIKMIGRYL
nr:MAG TPA: hypothetical protein [Caudoviricetes sp.]